MCLRCWTLGRSIQKSRKLNLATDIVNRGYGDGIRDFLDENIIGYTGDIATNPPYKYAEEFVKKALEIVPDGCKVCMFLKVLFLESKSRKKLFEKYPPKVIYVSSSRITCSKNGDFESYPSSALAYAWFVWEKGYQGETIVKWIN